MDYSQYKYPQYPPGYSDPYAPQHQQQQQHAQAHQQQYHSQYHQYQHQQYQATPPQIRNPFAAPAPSHSAYASHNASFHPEYEAQVAQWQSAYAPQEPSEKNSKNPKSSEPATGGAATARTSTPSENPAGIAGITAAAGPTLPAEGQTDGKKKTVIRKGGGQTWEDPTLLEWDPTQFRIIVGNLAGEVTDDSLGKAFAQYGVAKARVVRDKRTTKSRGYGFVSFTDGEMGFRAAREMAGKYIGSHPVTIQRSKTDLRPVVQKERHNNKGKFARNNNTNKGGKSHEDPLRAHTGAHIEKKPVRNVNGMKMLG